MLKLLRTDQVIAKNLEWMSTAKKRAKGLLIYENAPQDYCAIFELPLGGFFPLIHCFGMKFKIDVLFCNRKKEVLAKRQNLLPGQLFMPWRYFFGGAKYLLEFSACSIRDVKLGDKLEWGAKDDS